MSKKIIIPDLQEKGDTIAVLVASSAPGWQIARLCGNPYFDEDAQDIMVQVMLMPTCFMCYAVWNKHYGHWEIINLSGYTGDYKESLRETANDRKPKNKRGTNSKA